MPAVGDARAARKRQLAVGRCEQLELVRDDARGEIGLRVVEAHLALRAQRTARRALELHLLEVDEVMRERDADHAVLQLHALVDHRGRNAVADQRAREIRLPDCAAQRELQREMAVEQVSRPEHAARVPERGHVRLDGAADRRLVCDGEDAVARHERRVGIDVEHAHAARLGMRREREAVAAAEGRAHVEVAHAERGKATADLGRDVAQAAFDLHIAGGRRADGEVPVAVEDQIGPERGRHARELLPDLHDARERHVGERARRADAAMVEIERFQLE
ncbi:hypothetical protein NECAME_18961 [Necator americanus]|uniref:Uncharacterized protein n=1 Tax=Necator americanus TaxID=51031 RepID=W2SRG2_NECAM|nr:hypothetical protein NECAME_18961 [Necator americanus]ETN72220.1 hypothetical protein NECAME_18961 [Necator americanus]